MSLTYECTRYWNCLDYTRHGMPHKVDGPAEVWNSSDLIWLQYGITHRNDGPAYIILNDTKIKRYYLRGMKYTKEDYESKISSN